MASAEQKKGTDKMSLSHSDEHLIQNGDKVILRKENNIQIATVQKNKKYNLEKMWFHIDAAIGQPYGTLFEVKGKNIELVEEDTSAFQNFPDRLEPGKDNRNIVDDSASQRLSKEQIEEMRKQGEKGEDVVRQLVENSSSFKEKTEFSQEKYIRKKNKKHLNRFKILRPTTRLIAEMYFNKGPARINFLRVDALAQMLAYGNVRAGARQLVVESCNGLLLAATLERMADEPATQSNGVIVQLHHEQDPPRQALEGYPFHENQLKILHHLPLKFLAKVKAKCTAVTPKEENNQTDRETSPVPQKKRRLENPEDQELDGDISVETEGSPQNEPSDMETQEDGLEATSKEGAIFALFKAEPPSDECNSDYQGDVDDSTNGKDNKRLGNKAKVIDKDVLEQRRQARQNKIDRTITVLREGNFDSLLIAARVHPTQIAVRLLEYLKDSSPVCIFSPYKEPLIDCYQRLRDSGHVVHLRLSETWLRNYQVLPNRTHPEINMSTNGGYLLTFIKVSSMPPAAPFTR